MRKKILVSFTSLVAAFFIFSLSFAPRESLHAGLANSPWPKWGHDARNTSRQENHFTQTGGFSHFWTLDTAEYDTGVYFNGSPVIGADGTIYIGGYAPSAPVYAIDPSGTLKWRTALGNGSQPGISGSIALNASGDIIVSTPYGTSKISANSGAVLWTFTSFRSYSASPTIAPDGTIYVYGVNMQTGGAIFFALNDNGTLKWQKQISGSFDGTPAIASDGTVYFTTSDPKLWAVNADGTTQWTSTVIGGAISSPVVGNSGKIYVAGNDKLFAVNSDGTLAWQYDTGADYLGVGIAEASDGTIYVGAPGSPNYLYAINADGTLKWRIETESPIDGGLSVDGRGVVYAPANVSVYAIDTGGGKLWQYNKTSEGDYSFYGTPIISADSRLLIISAVSDGTITALIPTGLQSAIPSVKLSKPPTVHIDSPKSGEAVSGNIVLSYTATDPEGTANDFGLGDLPIAIDYSLGQGIIGTWKPYITAGKNEGKVTFDGKEFGDGAVAYFRVVVRDRTGLIDEDVIGPVSVDAIPPAFTLSAGTPKKAGFIDIMVTSTEPLIGAPDVYVDQAGRGRVLAITRGSERTFTARYEVVQGFDGVSNIDITGADLAGNVGNVILSGGRFSAFVTPPGTPTILEPKDGDIVPVLAISVSGTSVPSTRLTLTVNGKEQYAGESGVDGNFNFTAIKLSTSNRGINTISIVAEDAIGVSVPAVLTVSVNAPPKVVVTAPVTGKALSGMTRVTWSVEDENVDMQKYIFSHSADNGNTWITTATGIEGTAYLWDTTVVSDGPGNRIRITASDGFGESSAVAGPYLVKNNLPVVTIESPAAQFVNDRGITVRGSVDSELYRITSLAFRRDRATWVSVNAADGAFDSSKEAFMLELASQSSDGQVNMEFRAGDDRGKFGYRDLRFTIDTVPPQKPVIRIQEALPVYHSDDDLNNELDGMQIGIPGTAEAGSTVEISDGTLVVGSSVADRAGVFLVTVTVLGQGKFTLSAQAKDRAGNLSEKTVFVIAANRVPSMQFISPLADAFMGPRKRSISWRAADADGNTVGDFRLDARTVTGKNAVNAKRGAWVPIAEHIERSVYLWDIASTKPNGNYDLRLSGSDMLERSEVITPIRIDTVLPVISLASVIPSRTGDARFSADGTARDEFSGIEVVEFALGDEPFTKATIKSGWRQLTSEFRLTFPRELDDGTYRLHMRAVDRAENISATAVTVFTVDTTAPRIGSWRLSAGPLQLFPEAITGDDVQGESVRIFTDTPYTFTIAASEVVDLAHSDLTAGGKAIPLVFVAGGLMEGHMEFADIGSYPLHMTISDDLGNKRSAFLGALHTIEPARVTDAVSGEPILGAEVLVRQYDAAGAEWRDWDGAAWSQVNPQQTRRGGGFRYYLPEGTYEIRVHASGYRAAKSSPIEITSPTLVTVTIPLSKAGRLENFLQAF